MIYKVLKLKNFACNLKKKNLEIYVQGCLLKIHYNKEKLLTT